jgi:hypothetical protein
MQRGDPDHSVEWECSQPPQQGGNPSDDTVCYFIFDEVLIYVNVAVACGRTRPRPPPVPVLGIFTRAQVRRSGRPSAQAMPINAVEIGVGNGQNQRNSYGSLPVDTFMRRHRASSQRFALFRAGKSEGKGTVVASSGGGAPKERGGTAKGGGGTAKDGGGTAKGARGRMSAAPHD